MQEDQAKARQIARLKEQLEAAKRGEAKVAAKKRKAGSLRKVELLDSEEEDCSGGGQRRKPTMFFFTIDIGWYISGRMVSELARIRRHLVVRGYESAWCECADMAGGAGVD